jgi:ParB family chromosome partitioning protein
MRGDDDSASARGRADLQQTGKGEQCRLTLEIRDFDQLDALVERLTRR